MRPFVSLPYSLRRAAACRARFRRSAVWLCCPRGAIPTSPRWHGRPKPEIQPVLLLPGSPLQPCRPRLSRPREMLFSPVRQGRQARSWTTRSNSPTCSHRCHRCTGGRRSLPGSLQQPPPCTIQARASCRTAAAGPCAPAGGKYPSHPNDDAPGYVLKRGLTQEAFICEARP
jgi:hypothetical protein